MILKYRLKIIGENLGYLKNVNLIFKSMYVFIIIIFKKLVNFIVGF